MQSLPDLLAHGNAWLFIPTAILLGSLHGLEPGHSKTMMAAFIIAIRGTVGQAILLGVSAAISHSLVVWVIALGGQYLGRNVDAETTEPYLQLASAVIVLGVGAWMIWRTRRDQVQEAAHDHGHSHAHGDDHHHHHHDNHDHDHDDRTTVAGHGSAALNLAADGDYMDAHERAHASDIMQRFGGRSVTNGQILLFGLTGGLIPCPAAITVMLLCLQLKQITLGVVLVAFFSVGLAVTMVTAGVLASLSVKHIGKRWSGFSTFARRAPYASGGLMIVIALYMGISGWIGLSSGHLPPV